MNLGNDSGREGVHSGASQTSLYTGLERHDATLAVTPGIENSSTASSASSVRLENSNAIPKDRNGRIGSLKRHHQDSLEANRGVVAAKESPPIRPIESEPRIPTSCVYVSRDIFEVTCTRGKSLASCGFGFIIITHHSTADGLKRLTPATRTCPVCEDSIQDRARESDIAALRDSNLIPRERSNRLTKARNTALTTAATEYLFLEEVLFLHERGLLECCSREQAPSKTPPDRPYAEEKRSNSIHMDAPPSLVWDSFRLYSMLNREDTVSLSVYLVYAHLRKQGFRVIRHTPRRRAIIEALEDSRNDSGSRGRSKGSDPSTLQRHALREDAASAVAPLLSALAWDVYEPNSRFKRSSPGLPDFYVAVVPYNSPMKVDRILELIAECDGILFQIGAVSDSGQVVMLGIHDFTAPLVHADGEATKFIRES